MSKTVEEMARELEEELATAYGCLEGEMGFSRELEEQLEIIRSSGAERRSE